MLLNSKRYSFFRRVKLEKQTKIGKYQAEFYKTCTVLISLCSKEPKIKKKNGTKKGNRMSER